MSKIASKELDQHMAQELGLLISPFMLTLKHARQLTKVVKGFVFVYTRDGQTFYDTVDAWTETNGLRKRVVRFITHPCIEERLGKHQYQRWYVRDGITLYPLQTSKVEDLKEHFYFCTDSDPRYRTQVAFVGETQFIRKKPLVAMRRLQPGWGIVLPSERPCFTSRPKLAVAT